MNNEITPMHGRTAHAQSLASDLAWLESYIDYRLNDLTVYPQAPENQGAEDSTYLEFLAEQRLSDTERLVLVLALAPHLKPELMDAFQNEAVFKRARPAKTERGDALLPTVETALFLLAGSDLKLRFQYQELFEVEHRFYCDSILEIGNTAVQEPDSFGILSVTPSYRDLFILNRARKPRFSADFPAEAVSTNLEWDDMVLSPFTSDQLQEVKDSLEFYDKMVEQWDMRKFATRGRRILFHGESGTGKTLAANLLGKYLGREVYRVDISLVTSKYIGETSKRLASLFNMAEDKGWILFFDEGDALFGQRKDASAQNNVSQYANQDTAYLLQRIENFNGIIIVATNLRTNMDAAFTRRFEHIVKFEGLDGALQHELWQRVFPKAISLPAGVNLPQLIQRYPLSPAAIVKTMERICLLAFKNGSTVIDAQEFTRCLQDAELKTKGQRSFG
jgi:hypothetical protein